MPRISTPMLAVLAALAVLLFLIFTGVLIYLATSRPMEPIPIGLA